MEKLRQTLKVRKERAILVAAVLRGKDVPDDLSELTALSESAGAVVVDRFQQKIRTINPGTYIGKGKVNQLSGRVRRYNADVVIFDNDLSPGQIRELEKIVEVKVLDRTDFRHIRHQSKDQTGQTTSRFSPVGIYISALDSYVVSLR